MVKKKYRKGKTPKKLPPAPVGRPPMFKSPEDMQALIDDYIHNCPDTRETIKDGEVVREPVYTITGLALHLGFCDRHSFYEYEKKSEFSYTIKRARTFIESDYEKSLRLNNCTGSIFALKNFGWKDNQDITIEQKSKSKEEIEAELSRLIGKIIA